MNGTLVVTFALVVAILVSLAKDFLELGIKPGAPLHDTIIRIFAILVALGVVLGDYTLHGGNWQNGVLVEAALGQALLVGVGAITSYHLITGSVWALITPGEQTTQPATSTPAVTALVPASVTKAEVVTPATVPPIMQAIGATQVVDSTPTSPPQP